ncbi:MAG: hypothetical protein AB7T31_16670 [Gemmatimonadales bacterium]
MVHIHFDGRSPTSSLVLGPAPWFRIAGNFIRQGPEGTPVAIYRSHQWDVQGRYFTRWDCKEPGLIHFEDVAGGRTEYFGPFGRFHAADGVLYADDELFAKFIEEAQLWHCYATENFWPVLVFEGLSAGAGEQGG